MTQKFKMENNDLYHHGVKGQRWGVRRFQNKNGSLTSLGKKRRKTIESEEKNSDTEPKKKSVKNMSDEEIKSAINRLKLENDYKKAIADSKTTSRGKAFVKTVGNEVIKPAAIDMGKQVVKSAISASVNHLEVNGVRIGDTQYKLHTNNKKKDK